MKRVTGIGGIFFKSADVGQTKEWYAKHLGIEPGDYGMSFRWRKEENPEEFGQTLLTMFSKETKYFGSPEQAYMINFRVENLEALIEALKAEGVTIVDEMATYDFGKFVHILDNNGNKIELWEPLGE